MARHISASILALTAALAVTACGDNKKQDSNLDTTTAVGGFASVSGSIGHWGGEGIFFSIEESHVETGAKAMGNYLASVGKPSHPSTIPLPPPFLGAPIPGGFGINGGSVSGSTPNDLFSGTYSFDVEKGIPWLNAKKELRIEREDGAYLVFNLYGFDVSNWQPSEDLTMTVTKLGK